MTRYKWTSASAVPIRGVRAQIAGEELERIRTKHKGKLNNADVVEEARSKKSPLHRYFDWDDSSAAAKYRIEQAKLLIRSIEVVVEIGKGKSRDLRAFVSVTRNEERSYTSIAHAMGDAELRAQVLQDALRELHSWRARYSALSEFAKVFAAIDKVKLKRVA